jgi:hypothetical protein
MRNVFYSIFLCVIIGFSSYAQQTDYNTTLFNHSKVKVFDPKNYTPGFSVELKHLEAPKPDGESYRSFLMRVKAESARRFPVTGKKSKAAGTATGAALIKGRNFGMTRYVLALDSVVPIGGGTPLDNTMAVSNGGLLLGSVNSLLYGYDLNVDTSLFNNRFGYIDFEDFADNIGTSFPFDPKLLYDPEQDRFVFVFLSGRTPSDSKIIIGFSSTNNPTDPWNIYEITGNPLSNNTWTDYPAIALTKNEVFLTINLLRAGEPWQTGFAGSIIWQIDKAAGYSGTTTLPSRLWSDIKTDGRLLRNLNPIQGGIGLTGPNIYLLSNRNFDVQNDSIFMVEVTDIMNSPESQLITRIGKANNPYGAPPNGTQADANPVTDSTGFDTNDGRILGGFIHNNKIQFVANTKNFETGLAAVYHGFIDHLDSTISVEANVIGDDVLDFGYPNIAYSGREDCEEEAIIGFNHTSASVFSGISAIHYNGQEKEYSEVLRLKEGLNFVDRISGPYERWGDYFGIQRRYNEAGKVWTAGFYGLPNSGSSTWFTEVESPDSTVMIVSMDTIQLSTSQCHGELAISVEGGNAPYTYFWNGTPSSPPHNYGVDLCKDTFEFMVIDRLGCTVTAKGKFSKERKEEDIKDNFVLYPNPSNGRIGLNLTSAIDRNIEIRVYDLLGKLVGELLDETLLKGENYFSFSTLPLASGSYIIAIYVDESVLFNSRFLVP